MIDNSGAGTAQDAQHEQDDDHDSSRLEPLFLVGLTAQILEAERIDRVEVGAAVAAAQGDRLDRLAASRALLGISPGRERRLGRCGLVARGCVLAAIRPTAADVGPALAMVHLVASRAGENDLIGLDGRLADRASRALAPRIGQGRGDDPTLSGWYQLSLAFRAAKRLGRAGFRQADPGTAGARDQGGHRLKVLPARATYALRSRVGRSGPWCRNLRAQNCERSAPMKPTSYP